MLTEIAEYVPRLERMFTRQDYADVICAHEKFTEVKVTYERRRTLSAAVEVLSSFVSSGMPQINLFDLDGTVTKQLRDYRDGGFRAMLSGVPIVSPFLNLLNTSSLLGLRDWLHSLPQIRPFMDALNIRSIFDEDGLRQVQTRLSNVIFVTNRREGGLSSFLFGNDSFLDVGRSHFNENPLFNGLNRQVPDTAFWNFIPGRDPVQYARFQSYLTEMAEHLRDGHEKVHLNFVFDAGNIMTVITDIFKAEKYFIWGILELLTQNGLDASRIQVNLVSIGKGKNGNKA